MENSGFRAVLQQSGHLVSVLHQLEGRTDLLADGGSAIAAVVENWQNVFRATHIALQSVNQQEQREDMPALVRIPVESGDAAGGQEGQR